MIMKTITIQSKSRNEMINITSQIQELVSEVKISNGIVIVYVPHTTAAVTINEGADPSVQQDIINTLKQVIPERASFQHAEGNSDAHIKASLLGPSETILIENGNLVLGTWQHIFFYEGDGPRTRKVYVDIISRP